jgi:tetratricopeptide (TPR) repeat protein
VAKQNPVQLKREAEAAEKKQDWARAVQLWQELVSESSKPDPNTTNRIGDIYANKLNNLKAANEHYVKVARHYGDDGFYLKAIAVWKKILKNDPSMIEGHLALGDLNARQGLVAEAKQSLSYVVDEYIKRNKKREAGEVLRRLAEVDPADMKVRSLLAELYAREGQQDKAASEYLAIVEELVKKGKLPEALQFIEKALKSGPRSPLLLAAAARVHHVQKNFPRAIELLEEARRAAPGDHDVSLRLAEAYLGSKRPEEARRVLEALIERDPSDQDARQQLGQVYLAEGRYDEAFEQLQPAVDKLVDRRQVDRGATLLQQIVQRNPQHIRSLAKLVELYRVARNDALVAQTYSQMVEAYLASGGLEQAASILEMLVQLEPHNEQHRGKLKWLREQQGEPGLDVDFDRPLAPPLSPVSLPSAPAEKPGIELSGPLSADDKEFVEEHLNEGRVFRKYGLVDKARDQLEAVLSRFPDDLDALQELVDLHREKGESAAAAQRLRVMAEVHRLKGEPDKATGFDTEADGLAPAPVAPVAAPVPAGRPAPTPPAARPAPIKPSVPPPAAAPPGVEITLDEPMPEEQQVQGEVPVLEELEDLEPAPPEPEPHLFAVDDLAPAEGEIGGQFIEDEAPEGAFDLEEAAAATPVTVGLVAQGAPAVATGEVPPELQRVLDEIESYVSMGFVDDARGVLNEVRGRFGSHPAFAQRLAELGLDLDVAPAPAPPPASPEDLLAEMPEPAPAVGEEPLQLGSDFLEFTPTEPQAAPEPAPPPPALGGDGTDGFDLASELGGLFGAQAAVGTEVERGVDKQLGKEDYETRYNLGIAYKEMGLVDEAIAEFQLAAKDEARLLECASMLGICFVEKGMPKLAVKWFEKGLAAPGRTEEEYQGLRYDLASALEQAGETDRALAIFTELYGQDATFRDVAQKVRLLGAGA